MEVLFEDADAAWSQDGFADHVASGRAPYLDETVVVDEAADGTVERKFIGSSPPSGWESRDPRAGGGGSSSSRAGGVVVPSSSSEDPRRAPPTLSPPYQKTLSRLPHVVKDKLPYRRKLGLVEVAVNQSHFLRGEILKQDDVLSLASVPGLPFDAPSSVSDLDIELLEAEKIDAAYVTQNLFQRKTERFLGWWRARQVADRRRPERRSEDRREEEGADGGGRGKSWRERCRSRWRKFRAKHFFAVVFGFDFVGRCVVALRDVWFPKLWGMCLDVGAYISVDLWADVFLISLAWTLLGAQFLRGK